jgi:transposase-like protein
MAATKTTEARWRALVREQEASGKSAKEFARQRGFSPATLYWWRSALRRRACSWSRGPRLAEVTLLAGNGPVNHGDAEAFELALPGGRRLRVPSGFDPESLRRLLGVLEERC